MCGAAGDDGCDAGATTTATRGANPGAAAAAPGGFADSSGATGEVGSVPTSRISATPAASDGEEDAPKGATAVDISSDGLASGVAALSGSEGCRESRFSRGVGMASGVGERGGSDSILGPLQDRS